jgi:hypothetical protein
MADIFVRKIQSLNKKTRLAKSQSEINRPSLPVAGYERQLHITQDGIVSQGGGEIYYTNAAGDLANVLMTDKEDIFRNVIRTRDYNEISNRGSSLGADCVLGDPASFTGDCL